MLVVKVTAAVKLPLVSKLHFPITKETVDFSTSFCREMSPCCQQFPPSHCCWISQLVPSKAFLPVRSVPDLLPLD